MFPVFIHLPREKPHISKRKTGWFRVLPLKPRFLLFLVSQGWKHSVTCQESVTQMFSQSRALWSSLSSAASRKWGHHMLESRTQGLETVEASAHLQVKIPLRNPCHFLPGQEALCVYNKQLGRLKESPLFILKAVLSLLRLKGTTHEWLWMRCAVFILLGCWEDNSKGGYQSTQ